MLPTASFSKDALLSQTEGQVSHDFFLKLAHILLLLPSPQIVCYFPTDQHIKIQDMKHTTKVNRKVEYIHSLL